jgi:hypothetical protein
MAGSNLRETMQAQNLINQMQSSGPKSYNVNPSQPHCHQCGTYHPPLAPGEKCPLAEPKTADGKKIDTSKMVVQLRDILISQMEQKNIKDPDKFFKFVILELMKSLEGYKEDG